MLQPSISSGRTFRAGPGNLSSGSYIYLTIKSLNKGIDFKTVADQRNWFGRPFLNLAEEMAMIKALGN